MGKQLASILVGDHLGQVKKVLLPSGEISILSDCTTPSSSNPVVSIEQVGNKSKHLIANKNGELYIHDSVHGKTKKCDISGTDSLVKAIPLGNDTDVALIYDKQILIEGTKSGIIKQKKGLIVNAKVNNNQLAIVGKDIPLKIFDINTRNKIFEADLPEKNWLGIQPECVVAGLDFVGRTRIATCSKSDSVIRVYDIQQGGTGKSGAKPIIKVDLNQTAFNEHAESSRFVSVASSGDTGHSIVVGSNVGQVLAIDLRFNVKQMPKKKLQPKTFKVLGGFKGSRGATIKDLKIVPHIEEDTLNIINQTDDETNDHGRDQKYQVISCCLDRYMRIYNFTRSSRKLNKEIYMKTKPLCCSPVFYE